VEQRVIAGHHDVDDRAVLDAVQASVLSHRPLQRLRAWTASARSAGWAIT